MACSLACTTLALGGGEEGTSPAPARARTCPPRPMISISSTALMSLMRNSVLHAERESVDMTLQQQGHSCLSSSLRPTAPWLHKSLWPLNKTPTQR